MCDVIDARINGQNVSLVISKSDGQEIRKRIRIDQFVSILNDATDTTSYRRIGTIPDGLVDFAVGDGIGTFKAALRVPAGIHPFTYYGDGYTIPFPELLFCIQTKDQRLIASSVYAIRKDEKLCHYPFGNVYEDGKICWGSTKLSKVSELYQIGNVLSLFFGSETNNDLYHNGVNVVAEDRFEYQRGLIEALTDRDSFPEEWLIPCANNVTITQKINNFMEL